MKTALRLVVALLAIASLVSVSPALPLSGQVDRGIWHIADPDPPTGA